MTRKYFGTDGIRGRVNTTKLTPEVALKAGMAAGKIFTRGAHRHRVVIGAVYLRKFWASSTSPTTASPMAGSIWSRAARCCTAGR